MLLLDLTHTSHTRAQTGVQRVCRGLYRELKRAHSTEPVTYDPFLRAWRPLQLWELQTLDSTAPAKKRGARWPLAAQWRGRLQRWMGRGSTSLPRANGLIVPEIFSPTVTQALPQLFAGVKGPRIALFHDAIALKHPDLSPRGTVARFPSYLQELTLFDGVAAVSKDSAQSLGEYWDWLGLGMRERPEIAAIPLPLFIEVSVRDLTPAGKRPVVLSVGSIEGRKNHPALLRACEQLWSSGLDFELHLIGLAHQVTGRTALKQLQEMKSRGRPVRYDGAVPDAELHQAYAECAFTVYPSLIEGFGLPVLESVAHGKPCICSDSGALGESARGGGCLALSSLSSEALAAAIRTLLTDAELRQKLASEAKARTFKTWPEYVEQLSEWMRTLPSALPAQL